MGTVIDLGTEKPGVVRAGAEKILSIANGTDSVIVMRSARQHYQVRRYRHGLLVEKRSRAGRLKAQALALALAAEHVLGGWEPLEQATFLRAPALSAPGKRRAR